MDFVMLAAMAVGLIAMYYYFKESHAAPKCAGASGNCVYNTCKRDYCWRSLAYGGTPREGIYQACKAGLPSATTIAQGCSTARSFFLFCAQANSPCKLQVVPGV